VSTPYIRGASERINKIMRNFDVKLSNRASNTLGRKLFNFKD